MVKIQIAIPFFGILIWCPGISLQQYHLVRAWLSWDEALRYCTVKHAGLATINHMRDQEALTGSLHGAADAWIGLRKGTRNRWVWSDGYGETMFTRWKDGEPSNDHGDNACVEMSQYGTWNDLSCNDKRTYVCYQDQGNGGKSFAFYSVEKTWALSLDHCRDAHTDLAHISNVNQNSDISKLIGSWTGFFGFPKKAWLGLFRDRWFWSGGASTSFRFWQTGYTSHGDCGLVAAGHNRRWIPENCGRSAMVVCEGGLRVKKLVLRMEMSSWVDLSNTTVSTALLMKLHSNLTQHHLTDFTLSWRRSRHGAALHRLDPPEVPETKQDADC